VRDWDQAIALYERKGATAAVTRARRAQAAVATPIEPLL
jgi:hypothetical protein